MSNFSNKNVRSFTLFVTIITIISYCWVSPNLPTKTAFELLEMMYSPNILYRSVGIILEEFKTSSNEQLNMFEDQIKKEKSERLGKAIDRIEEKFGRNKIKVGFTNKDVPNKQGFMTCPKQIY